MDALREEMQSRWNTDGMHYDETPAHGMQDEKERLPWIALFSPVSRKETEILDVGTGTGFVALIAAEQGLTVTGLDWSEIMLAQAREKAADRGLTVHWVQGLIETLPFQDNRFDLLSARHVLWTLLDPPGAFREWRRVLRPGGTVYADYSPQMGNGHHGHHYSEETERKLPLNHDVSVESITGMLRDAGFTEVSMVSREREFMHDDAVHTKPVFMFTCVK
jgi:SAM-dependent methyltransferase